jgi:DNA adenine methylase
VLRNQKDELIEAIGLTSFSREELFWALSNNSDNLKPESDLERARPFFIRARQSRTGLAQTASLGRWANCLNTSRAGMAGAVSRWLGSVESLPQIAARLLSVQIENRPANEVIKLYDSPDTLFYCDPPYVHTTRGDKRAYGYEMDQVAYLQLADTLSHCKGKIAVSGYRCELMDNLFKGWHCYEAPPKICHSVKQPRFEALWMNY